MNAMRNMIHGVALATWALLGVIFSIKALVLISSGPMVGLLGIAGFWVWLGAFGGITTAIVTKLERPVGALITHAVAVGALLIIPRVFPLNLVRYGLDAVLGNL